MLSATPWLPSSSDVVDRVSDEAIGTQPEAAYVAPSESGMRDAVVDSVMIINPDSMRPAENPEGSAARTSSAWVCSPRSMRAYIRTQSRTAPPSSL